MNSGSTYQKACQKDPLRQVRCRNDTDVSAYRNVLHDFEVVYVRCPKCGKKYQIITTDTEMRALIKKRNSLEKLIKRACERNLKATTINSYIRQRDRIMKIQKRLNEYLFPMGEEILKEGESGDTK